MRGSYWLASCRLDTSLRPGARVTRNSAAERRTQNAECRTQNAERISRAELTRIAGAFLELDGLLLSSDLEHEKLSGPMRQAEGDPLYLKSKSGQPTEMIAAQTLVMTQSAPVWLLVGPLRHSKLAPSSSARGRSSIGRRSSTQPDWGLALGPAVAIERLARLSRSPPARSATDANQQVAGREVRGLIRGPRRLARGSPQLLTPAESNHLGANNESCCLSSLDRSHRARQTNHEKPS